MCPWTWISFFVFSERNFIWAQQSRPVNKASLQWGGWPGGVASELLWPPTRVDAARVILAGSLRNPGFLCISGTKGSHVAYGKPLQLRLPHLLQVGWCELSRWSLLRHSWTHPGCWGSHKLCMCLVVGLGDLALHSACMLLPLLHLQRTPHFIHKIILNV